MNERGALRGLRVLIWAAIAVEVPVSLFHLDQAASSRATTARTTAVIRVVLQRSFRRSRQDLRIAMARSPRLRIFAWSRL